jgi:hypothetical protein
MPIMPPIMRRTIIVTITETWTLIWGEPQASDEMAATAPDGAPATTASWSVQRVSELSTVNALPTAEEEPSAPIS